MADLDATTAEAAAGEPEEIEETIDFTAIVRAVSLELWHEIFNACSRKAREAYFHRHGIRKPKSSSKLLHVGANNEVRATGLHHALQEVQDHEMCEEILRTWLLGKRDLLAAALDHLGIEHEDGLTESDDVDKLKTLDPAALSELCRALLPRFNKGEIAVYLKFMGAKDVDVVLAKL
jgi:hypothetical protein